LHSNEAPAAEAVNAKEAAVDPTLPLGPLVIEVSGAVDEVPAVQVRVAGVASTLPTASLARTEKVCDPSPNPE
jgi:uncharacterized NAD(P)/FAD-binding protein YdhS